MPGQRIEIAVPFDGDRSLMHVKASQYSMNPPRADVIGNELIIVFTGTQLDSEVVKRQLDATLNSIEECLSWVRTDIDRWHQQLERLSAESIRDRKQRLLVQMNTVAAIGIPIRRREGTGPSYSVPLERRARPKVLPSPSTTPFKPEPVLAIEEYAFIIDVIQRLSVQIERSPTTFIGMSEPQIRDFILVHLNGHFDGGASGETFNASGKTDILIRANGGNVFVAECKFWEGPKGLVQAVDQLLSYLTWRDTKASLIVFSKNTDFTNVIAEARKAIETHPSFKKVVAHQGETRSQFLFRLPQDANREVHMTLQLFNIPRQTPVSGEA